VHHCILLEHLLFQKYCSSRSEWNIFMSTRTTGLGVKAICWIHTTHTLSRFRFPVFTFRGLWLDSKPTTRWLVVSRHPSVIAICRHCLRAIVWLRSACVFSVPWAGFYFAYNGVLACNIGPDLFRPLFGRPPADALFLTSLYNPKKAENQRAQVVDPHALRPARQACSPTLVRWNRPKTYP
jgi:hypothetical protein